MLRVTLALFVGCGAPPAPAPVTEPSPTLVDPSPPLPAPPWPVLGDAGTVEGYVYALRWLDEGLLVASTAGPTRTVPDSEWVAAARSPEAWQRLQILVRGDRPKGVRLQLRDAEGGPTRARYRIDSMHFDTSPDGTRLLAAPVDGEATLASLTTGDPAPGPRPPRYASDARWSPDGRVLAQPGRELALWSVETGDLTSFRLPGQRPPDPEALFYEGPTAHSIGWAPDSASFVALVSDTRKTDRLEVVRGTLGGQLEELGQTEAQALARIGPDLLLHGDGRLRRVHDAVDLPERWSLEHVACSVAVSPDASRVVVADDQGRLSLLDAETGTPLATSTSWPCPQLAWSPQGDRLAVARGSEVALHDAASLERRSPLRHPHGVVLLEADPTGQTLLSASHAGDVLLWDLAKGQARPVHRDARGAWANWTSDHDLDREVLQRSRPARLLGDTVLFDAGSSGGEDHHLGLWSTRGGLTTHTAAPSGDDYGLRPDGQLVIVSSRELRLVDRRGRRVDRPLSIGLAVAHDGSRYVERRDPQFPPEGAAAGDGPATTFLVDTSDPTSATPIRGDLPTACAFSHDDASVVCAGVDWVALVDAASGADRFRARLDGTPEKALAASVLRGAGADAVAVGAGLVTVLSNGHLEVFDAATGAPRFASTWAEPAITAATPLPSGDGPKVAVGDAWGRIHLVPIP